MKELTEEEQLTFDILSAPPTKNEFELFRQRNDKMWIQKNRVIIPIAEMETRHIINSMEMLAKLNQQYTRAYRGLKQELLSRK